MARIVFVDDDAAIELLMQRLEFRGHTVERHSSLTKALETIEDLAQADLVVLDMLMEAPAEAAGGPAPAGLALAVELRRMRTDLPLLAYTASQDPTVREMFSDDANAEFIGKWAAPTLSDLTTSISAMVGDGVTPPSPGAFIVHGHDEQALISLKNYLQNTLGFTEPTILREQPSLGRTIIEKFEDYAGISNIAFILLTPDDEMAAPDDSDDVKRRARQNIILELGFFMAQFGRKSGRVILLHKGVVDIPSDISGIVYIDISEGIEAAGEAIRRELQDVLN